jgi:plastocyanin/adenosine/AMP kinase
MKTKYNLIFFFILLFSQLNATNYSIATTAQHTYSPSSLTINVGDVVTISASNVHPLVQVDQSTWNVNGSAPLSNGWGTKTSNYSFTATTVTTIYFVCQNHVGLGMKGKIIVQSSKTNQTITFGAITAKTFGDIDFDAAATASSGLAVTYSSDNLKIASIVNNKIHIIEAGSCNITASQPGNGTYNAAPDVVQKLTINKADQIISFQTLASKTFNDPDFDPLASSNSGLLVTYTSDNLNIATLVNGKIHIVAAGTCNILASQPGNNNFNAATSVSRELIVNKADQIITFVKLPVKTYNDSDFYTQGSSNSGLAINYTSDSLNVATIVEGKIHITGAGSCTITASQEGNGNYNAAENINRTLIVNKASQIISFNTIPIKTILDSDFNPGAVSSSGLPVIYSTDSTNIAAIKDNIVHLVSPGTCKIYAMQAGNKNYSSVLDSQALIVNKADQSITFDSIPVKTIQTEDFNPGAISGSGLPIIYSSDNFSIAIIKNGLVHVTGIGACTITASQPGNKFYNQAIDITRKLIVNDKNAQTITFNSLPTKTVLDTDFAPGAFSSSGLMVNYESSDTVVAKIVNNKIHLIGAGTSFITAIQGGDSIYNPAKNVQQALTINKLEQSIDFPSIPFKTYSDSDFFIVAMASSGLTVTYSIDSLNIATITDGKIHIVSTGVCTITATQTGNNIYYPSIESKQTLTIKKLGQTISISSIPTKTYGDTDFILEATSTSGLPISFDTDSAEIATIVNGKVHIVRAGECSIVMQQNGNSIYDPAPEVKQILKINKSDQTVDFAVIATKLIGDSDFNPGAISSSGLEIIYESNDTSIAIVQNSKIKIVASGTCEISAMQPGNMNYNPSLVIKQMLTVNKLNQSISFLPLMNKLINDSDFNAGATASSGLTVTYESSDSNVAKIVDNKVHISGAGNCFIIASQNGNNIFDPATNIRQSFTVESPININIVPAENLNIYPNPTIGEFYIRLTKNNQSEAFVNIYDLSGKVVLTKYISGELNLINLGNQPKGLYLIEVKTNNSRQVSKIFLH